MDPEDEVSDYEEDVIPPHSPLHEYMNSYVAEESLDEPRNELTRVNASRSFSGGSNSVCFLTQSVCHILKSLRVMLKGIQCTLVPSLVPCYQYAMKNHMLKSDVFKNMLVSEDLAMLSGYEFDENEANYAYFPFPQPLVQLLGFVLVYFILSSPSVFQHITDVAFVGDSFHDALSIIRLSFWLFYWLCGPVIVLALIILIFICFELASFFILWLCLRRKLVQSENVMKNIKKNLRLIQEAELIARGFTSASIPGIVERLELSSKLPLHSPERQYPELRKFIFLWTKQLFLFYREGTKTLLGFSKYDPTKDFASDYLASLSIQEFGDFFRYDPDSDSDMQELLKSSDNLSVSSLKTMYFLAELQMSEFFKCLYLKISLANSLDNLYQILYRIYLYTCFVNCLETVKHEEKYILKEILKVYKHYRSFEMSVDTEKSSASKNSQMTSFEINMHNMSLHLKSALKRLNDLEELLETHPKASHPKTAQKAEDMFKEIKCEIGAYEEYYEKCYKELKGVVQCGEEKLANNQPKPQDEKIENVPRRVIQCDAEPVIEDEIFEDVASKSCTEEESSQYSSNECRKDMESAGKLLNELKNVLVFKATEHKTREKIAIAKKNKEKYVPNDIPDSESSSESSVEASPIIKPRNISIVSPNADKSESYEALKSYESDEGLSLVTELPVNQSIAEKYLKTKQEDCFSIQSQNEGIDAATQNSFAAAIAALAKQRQQCLGVSSDVMFSDQASSDDDEVI